MPETMDLEQKEFPIDLERMMEYEEEEEAIDEALGPPEQKTMQRGKPNQMTPMMDLYDQQDGTKFHLLRKAAPHYLKKRTDDGKRRYGMEPPAAITKPPTTWESQSFDTSFKCERCGKGTPSVVILDMHMRSYHNQTRQMLREAEQRQEREDTRRLLELQMEQNAMIAQLLASAQQAATKGK